MNLLSRIVWTLLLLVPGFVFLPAAPAAADTLTFSCAAPDPADCNGATYALAITEVQDLGDGTFYYELVFGIDTAGYNGNLTDYIRAVSFKNVVDDMTNLQLIDAPFGEENWNIVELGLNAKGCKDANGEEGACTEALATLNDGYGAPVTLGGTSTQYFWTFSFYSTDGTPNATGSIKYQYVTNDPLNQKGEYTKIGSIGSFDTPLSVPEPGSLLLFSSGLVAIFARKRILT